jgi:hypothetical protein
VHFLISVDHLLQTWGIGVDHVIGQKHGKRLLTDKFFRHQYGVTQTQRLLLPYIGEMDHVADAAHDTQQLSFAALFEHVL